LIYIPTPAYLSVDTQDGTIEENGQERERSEERLEKDVRPAASLLSRLSALFLDFQHVDIEDQRLAGQGMIRIDDD
jgi:hypothetical protein